MSLNHFFYFQGLKVIDLTNLLEDTQKTQQQIFRYNGRQRALSLSTRLFKFVFFLVPIGTWTKGVSRYFQRGLRYRLTLRTISTQLTQVSIYEISFKQKVDEIIGTLLKEKYVITFGVQIISVCVFLQSLPISTKSTSPLFESLLSDPLSLRHVEQRNHSLPTQSLLLPSTWSENQYGEESRNLFYQKNQVQ